MELGGRDLPVAARARHRRQLSLSAHMQSFGLGASEARKSLSRAEERVRGDVICYRRHSASYGLSFVLYMDMPFQSLSGDP